LSDELKAEGISREVVNRIQNMRKDSGFEVTDRISVEIDTTDAVAKAIKQFEVYICSEVLANSIHFVKLMDGTKEAIETDGDTVFNIIKSN
jgi:isoleucyl-tRNA synthetase